MSAVCRGLLAGLLALVALLGAPSGARAHGNVVDASTPADGSTVRGAVPITIRFTEPVRPALATFTLRAPDGSAIELGEPVFGKDATTVTLHPAALTRDGWYRIGYQVVVTSGDTSTGSIRFALSASGTPIPDPEAASTVPTPTGEQEATSALLPVALGAGALVVAGLVTAVVIRRRRAG